MTRAEFIQRAALTLVFESNSLSHLEAYADQVNEIAPFDEYDPLQRLANCVSANGETFEVVVFEP